jgi:hypothetical protein
MHVVRMHHNYFLICCTLLRCTAQPTVLGSSHQPCTAIAAAVGELATVGTGTDRPTGTVHYIPVKVLSKLVNVLVPLSIFSSALIACGSRMRSDVSFCWTHEPDLRSYVVRTDWIRTTPIDCMSMCMSRYRA